MPEDNENGGGGNGQEAEAFNPDEWLGSLEEPVQKQVSQFHEAKVTGLKSALDAERSSRKDLETQVRDLAKKAEKGSEYETQLTEFADKLEAESKRNAAYDILHEAGVANLKAAYTLAAADELFDRSGNVDVDALKQEHPYLFPAKTGPRGNAGNGTGGDQRGPVSMNDMIRAKAGV